MSDDARSRIELAAELETMVNENEYDLNRFDKHLLREAAAALRLPRVEALQESVDSIHEHLLAAVRAESPVPRVEAGGPLRALALTIRGFVRDCATNWDHDRNAHSYGTPCRTCSAELLLPELDAPLAALLAAPGASPEEPTIQDVFTSNAAADLKSDWARFLRERHLLILDWVAEGQSFEQIRRTLSMDLLQVQLISQTPRPKAKDRYAP